MSFSQELSAGRDGRENKSGATYCTRDNVQRRSWLAELTSGQSLSTFRRDRDWRPLTVAPVSKPAADCSKQSVSSSVLCTLRDAAQQEG